MNKYYRYDKYQIWDDKIWKGKFVPVDELVQWMSRLIPQEETDYPIPEGMVFPEINDETGFKGYLSSDEIAYWEERGVRIELHHIWVAKWISFVPLEAIRNSGINYPTIISIHKEHIEKPMWPMKILNKYRNYVEEMTGQKKIVLITVTDGPDTTQQYGNILMEACSLYPIDYHNIQLDLDGIYKAGKSLCDFKGYLPMDEAGTPMDNPEKYVIEFGKHKFLDISKTWKSTGSPHYGQLIGLNGNHSGNASYNAERFKHTIVAERLVEPISMENKYISANDAEFIKFLENRGVRYEAHDKKSERWITLTPICAFDETEKKLPVMLIFQEVYYCNDHLPIEAVSYWYEFCKLAMQGECMLLFYACERTEHNELLYDIFQDAVKMYPIDITRVYITGYSHNSMAAVHFAFNHPDMITAIAGGAFGGRPGMSDEMERKLIEEQSKIDMPCIMVMGQNEHSSPVGEATFENAGLQMKIKKDAIEACNCPPKTLDDFREAYKSPDKATRMAGMPNEHSEVLFLEGVEHYIIDIKNREGKNHFRFIMIENMPHNPFPTLQILEWSFVRRFARDIQTHKIIELY